MSFILTSQKFNYPFASKCPSKLWKKKKQQEQQQQQQQKDSPFPRRPPASLIVFNGSANQITAFA